MSVKTVKKNNIKEKIYGVSSSSFQCLDKCVQKENKIKPILKGFKATSQELKKKNNLSLNSKKVTFKLQKETIKRKRKVSKRKPYNVSKNKF